MPDVRMNTSSAAALAEAKERYAARQKQSARVYDDACKSLPGGNTADGAVLRPLPADVPARAPAAGYGMSTGTNI